MDDEFDIYGDLDGFQVEVQKESKVIKELKADIEELHAKIAEKESEKQSIATRNEILLENISSLLLTAKAELKRKDSLIADIRRQMDNQAFRRDRNRTVRKQDRGTQTPIVRMLSREVQTENVGTMTDKSLARERRKERGKSLERLRSARLVDLRDRLREKLSKENARTKAKERDDSPFEKRKNGNQRWDKSRERDRDRVRERERERERERKARHRATVKSPELSPVRFSHPLRVLGQEHDQTDSSSEAKLAEAFIPMNRKELDQFVKEIARSGNRSPDEVCSGSDRKKKATLDTSKSELWDDGLPLKKTEKLAPTRVEEKLIQSDEIGTTLSPGEDVEQKLRVLHGEPTPPVQKTPECPQTSTELLEVLNKSSVKRPPKLVIPPREPHIIELVPEMPSFEDDPRLNDSRELRIVESEEMLTDQLGDARKSPPEGDGADELEDGEIASSDGESAKAEDTRKGRSPRIASVGKLGSKRKDETKPKRTREARILLDKLDSSELRKYTGRDRKAERSKKDDRERHSKRSRTASVDAFGPSRTDRRRETAPSGVEKSRSKTRVSDPVKRKEGSAEAAHGKSKKETLKELFGSEDENSLLEPPVKGKRKHSIDKEESKDRKKQKIHSKEKDTKDEHRAEIQCSKSAELIVVPCEAVPIQSRTSPKEGLKKEHSRGHSRHKKVTPEEASTNVPHQEGPPIKTACEVEETSAKSVQHDQPLREASVEKSQNVQLPILASVVSSIVSLPEKIPPLKDPVDSSHQDALMEEIPANSLQHLPTASASSEEVCSLKNPIDTSHQGTSKKEISANLSGQDQPATTAASSDEVPVETQQQDQAIQEVSDGISQSEQLPMDASLPEQPSVDTHPQQVSLQDVSMEEISVPPPAVISDEVPVETCATDVNIATDQLPMDTSVEKTSSSTASPPKQPSVETPSQPDPAATCPQDAPMEEIRPNSPKHQPHPDASSEEAPKEANQNQPATEPSDDQLPTVDDALPAMTPAKTTSQQIDQIVVRSPEVVVFSNKYSEYRVEDNSETETTIYVTRKKKKKVKTGRAPA